jgi:SAM-dependent methyltransferase
LKYPAKELYIAFLTGKDMEGYKRDWDELAELDARWAIVTDPKKRARKWGEQEFFENGRTDVEKAFKRIGQSGAKLGKDKALDFGCGIGRLSLPLSSHFKEVYGVDVSRQMISEAEQLHRGNEKLRFVHNDKDNLMGFDSDTFDLVYSELTLQHIPDTDVIEGFVQEFVRILKPGGVLYFQLPSRPRYGNLKKSILKLRGNLYYNLTALGVPKDFCFSSLKLAPYMQMSHLPSEKLAELLKEQAEILGIFEGNTVDTKYVVRKK